MPLGSPGGAVGAILTAMQALLMPVALLLLGGSPSAVAAMSPLSLGSPGSVAGMAGGSPVQEQPCRGYRWAPQVERWERQAN